MAGARGAAPRVPTKEPDDAGNDAGNGVDNAAAEDNPGDPEAVARIVCLRMLDRRAYSRAELAAALQRRGVPDDAATAVLDRFHDVGLIDDAGLAYSLAQAQHAEHGLAARAVALKLRRRGIEDPDVRRAIATIDLDSERAAAQWLVARKLRSMHGLDPLVRARRLVGLLARKGYPPALAHEVVRAAIAEFDAQLADAGLDYEPG